MKDMFTDAEQEAYEERSAIREFCGGESREQAEEAARQEVIWERERFRCMVRKLLQWKEEGNIHLAKEWLNAQKNPTPYREAALEQWSLGNKGEHGVWLSDETQE